MVECDLDAAFGEVVQCFSWQSSKAHWTILPKQDLQCACAEDAQRWERQALVKALLRSGAGTCNCKDSYSAEVSVVVV